MIYFGGRYSCSVAGSVWKEVCCAECQCEYLYLLSRTGSGSGSSPYYIDNDGAQRRAEQAAVKNLQRRLERDCDAVPCPDCGMYQPLMVRLLRRRRWGWAHIVGWIGIAAAVVVAWLVGQMTGVRPVPSFGKRLISIPSIVFLGAGVGLIALSWGGRMLYDPNADAVERAGSRGPVSEGPYRRAEFEATMREMAMREEATRQAADGGLMLQLADRRICCPHCEQTFATSARDRCPLCHGDWINTPPRQVG
jgi:hypothetical protein